MDTATVKLFALLSRYLPPGAQANAVTVDLAPGATIGSIIAGLGVPDGKCHLVLLNGVFVPVAARASTPVGGGDVVAIWPPVAGG
jgi:sulfur carrier protein ThiS